MRPNLPVIHCVLLMLLTACSWDPPQISHQAFLQGHRFAIGQKTIEYFDSDRNRPLKTEIWYPTIDTTGINISKAYPFILPPTSQDVQIASGLHPLILLSHGTGGNRISLMWLAAELVGRGYMVAAVNHWGNTLDNKIPEQFVKIWHRPQDIQFILNRIMADFKAHIDTSRIGMAGFSLGGYTTLALAGGVMDYQTLANFAQTKDGEVEFTIPELGDLRPLLTPEVLAEGDKRSQSLKEPRIKAFLAMAPALGQGFTAPSQFSGIDQPVLIIGAERDQRTPIQTNAKHYHRLISGSEYIELTGKVGHYIFINQAKSFLKREAPFTFEDDPSVDRKEIHRRVSAIVLEFFEKALQGKEYG